MFFLVIGNQYWFCQSTQFRSPAMRADRRWQATYSCRWKYRKHPADPIDGKAVAPEHARPYCGDPSDKAPRRSRYFRTC